MLAIMQTSVVTDAKRIGELARQRNEKAECSLIEAHQRYLANMRETEATEASMNDVVAFLGPKAFDELIGTEGFVWLETEIAPTAADLREEAPLWEHIRTYLRFVPEARLSEMLELFGKVGIVTTRQALESALRTHPQIFGSRKRGRELFIYRRDLKWSESDRATSIRPTRRRT